MSLSSKYPHIHLSSLINVLPLKVIDIPKSSKFRTCSYILILVILVLKHIETNGFWRSPIFRTPPDTSVSRISVCPAEAGFMRRRKTAQASRSSTRGVSRGWKSCLSIVGSQGTSGNSMKFSCFTSF